MLGDDTSKNLCTPCKKTQLTVYTENTDAQHNKIFQTEKVIALGSTVADLNHRKRVEYSEPRASPSQQNYVKLSKSDSNPEKRQSQVLKNLKQTSVCEIVKMISKLVDFFYLNYEKMAENKIPSEAIQKLKNFNNNFRQDIIKIINSTKNKPKDLANHLNVIFYSAPSIMHMQLQHIQRTILSQLKQNPLLKAVLNLWFACIDKTLNEPQSSMFQPLFSHIYEQFCQFFSNLIFFVFKDYFLSEVQPYGKNKNQFKTRMINNIIRPVISKDYQWQNVVCKHILAYTYNNVPVTKQFKKELMKDLLNEFNILPLKKYFCKVVEKGECVFLQTRNAISRFIKETSTRQKIRWIVHVRISLEQDIISYQKQLIEAKQLKQFKMLDKDQILTCLILCVLSNEIDHQILYQILAKVTLMLGEGKQQILRSYKCLSYFDDMFATADFIRIEFSKKNNPV